MQSIVDPIDILKQIILKQRKDLTPKSFTIEEVKHRDKRNMRDFRIVYDNPPRAIGFRINNDCSYEWLLLLGKRISQNNNIK